jgi:hypothetical protein
MHCASTLGKPQHPLLDPFGQDIFYHRLYTSDDVSTDGPISIGSTQGFHHLQALGIPGDVVDVFLNLKDYSDAVDAYVNGASLPECMADNRNWVLHGLLCLPSVDATALPSQVGTSSQDFHRTMLCYEACRLTAVMYCIHVTFPVPRTMYARRLLLPQMEEAIVKIQLATGDRALGELVLWCVVVGGIAASSQPERSVFATQLINISTFLRLTRWSDAKVVLRKFPWLDSVCDRGGAAFWNEVL